MSESDRKWYRLSLRLMGDLLPIDEIEDRLGLKPDYIGRKGRHIADNPHYGLLPTNIWSFRPQFSREVEFAEQIEFMLKVLESKSEELQKIIQLPGVEAQLFLGFGSDNGQGGAHFPADLLLRVGRLGLDIDLDLYPPSEMQEDDVTLAPPRVTR